MPGKERETYEVQSSPLGATVAIDGKECGTTPEDFAGLLIGTHKITVSKSGYKTVSVDMEIKEGETAELCVTLEKAVTETPKQTNKTITAMGGTINGHEYVDLGLPSGIKWATCNVGATKPEEYGGYYAWGEIEEKEEYSWITYKWCNGSLNTLTKYCTNGSYGAVDNKTVLDPEDDVAHVKWGGSWRMPTKAELNELLTNCTWTWTTQNGVNGYKVTSKSNGNSIFLPAAGGRDGTDLHLSGSYGYCWSSSLHEDGSSLACYLYFNSSSYDWYYYSRYYGHSVRPVCK